MVTGSPVSAGDKSKAKVNENIRDVAEAIGNRGALGLSVTMTENKVSQHRNSRDLLPTCLAGRKWASLSQFAVNLRLIIANSPIE
jgi:S1-C subfamily serine protease